VFPTEDLTDATTASAEDRFRQFDAVSRLLHEVCRLRPLVLVLDDVHWSDKHTLLLLNHVARSVSDERMMIIGNSRPTEQRHPEILGRVARELLTTVLDLRGLPAAAVGRQLAIVLGEDVEASTGSVSCQGVKLRPTLEEALEASPATQRAGACAPALTCMFVGGGGRI